MKKSARNRIIIWSVVTVLLVGLLSLGIHFFSQYSLFGNNPFGMAALNEFDKYDYSRGNAEFKAEAVDSIEIDWISGNIKVIEGKGDKIKIEESSNSEIPQDKTMKYVLKDNQLKINPGNISNFINFFSPGFSKNLTVTLPKDKCLDELEISCASSDVTINGTNISEISADSASGKVEIIDAVGSTAEISTASGEITVDSEFDFIDSESVSGNTTITSRCTKLDSSSVSGEINADLTNDIEDIDMESVSGNINVALPKQIDGFNAKYETVSGDFSCDFTGKSNDSSFISGDGSTQINFGTVSGDMTISEN